MSAAAADSRPAAFRTETTKIGERARQNRVRLIATSS